MEIRVVKGQYFGKVGWAKFVDKGTVEKWWQASLAGKTVWLLRNEFEVLSD